MEPVEWWYEVTKNAAFFYLQITKMLQGVILIIAVPTIGKIKIRDANSESSRSV